MKWELIEAVALARKLEYWLIPVGAHCALGGSVLMQGFSDKDLDIFIYPHNAKPFESLAPIVKAIESAEIVDEAVRNPFKGSCDDSRAFVFKGSALHKTVDFFILAKDPRLLL